MRQSIIKTKTSACKKTPRLSDNLPVYKLLPGQPPVNAGQRDAGLPAGELLPIGPNIAGIDADILSSSPNVCIHCVRIIFSYGVATCLLLSSPAA